MPLPESIQNVLPISINEAITGLDPTQNEGAADRVAHVLHGVGSAIRNLMPGYAQAHAQQNTEQARQQSEFNLMVMRGAMEQAQKGNVEFLNDPTVQKTFKIVLGKQLAPVALGYFQHSANAIQQHQNSFGQLSAEMRANGANIQQIVDTAHQLNINVPPAIEKEATSYTYAPQVAQRTQEAKIPGQIAARAGETQAQQDVTYDPANVQRRTGAKVSEEQAVQDQVKDPAAIASENRKDTIAQARENRQEARGKAKEDRSAARKQGEQVSKTDNTPIKAAEASKIEAFDAGGNPVEIVPDQTTVGDLKNLTANGGKVRGKGTMGQKVMDYLFKAPGTPEPSAVPHVSDYQAVINRWSGQQP